MLSRVSESRPDVFLYLDYRAYLRAYYEERKRRAGFSYRVFSRMAKLGSPNYLKLVIDGQRNLTDAMAERFGKTCGLDGDAARYFALLVKFNQARTVEERNQYYTKLRRQRRYQEVHKLDLAQDMYHSRWYLPAIRELVASVDFREDPAWISQRLSPPVSAREVSIALKTLLELGLLVRDEDDQLRQGQATVSTGPEVRSLHLANFHRTMINHALSALDRFPSEQRDISSLTLCLGEDGLERVKKAIQRFRRELLEVEELEAEPKQVVQINFQLFPLSTAEEPESGE
jgi:uncharacterized protein (TIGR02147 family)